MDSGQRPLRDAAVLVPLYRDPAGALRLVVIRRAEGGIHGGQLAFPGGRREPRDRDLRETALREAEEEIGLPRAAVTVLAELPVIEVRASRSRVAPFVARIERPERWRPAEEEIGEVLEPRVEDLLRPEFHGESLERFPGWTEPRVIGFYRLGPHRLWGASYRILRPLLARLAAGEWEI
jgi:8-oxo-dGTP pyrophosphatase MutT (NUDIX family)